LKVVYDLFVSGGKDSVAAAILGAERALAEGAEYRVVHVDELSAFEVPRRLLPTDPLDYVERFADWLGADLVVLKPQISFWEGVKKWGYPLVYDKRWCYCWLKEEPLARFRFEELKEGASPVWVTGIRATESKRRAKLFKDEEYALPASDRFWYGKYKVKWWHPILFWSDREVEELIADRKPPENPLWKLGFSCECLCLAGTTKKKLDFLIAKMPEIFAWLAEKDREVQAARSSGRPAFPRPLVEEKVTLHEYVEKKLKSPTLEKWQGSPGDESFLAER